MELIYWLILGKVALISLGEKTLLSCKKGEIPIEFRKIILHTITIIQQNVCVWWIKICKFIVITSTLHLCAFVMRLIWHWNIIFVQRERSVDFRSKYSCPHFPPKMNKVFFALWTQQLDVVYHIIDHRRINRNLVPNYSGQAVQRTGYRLSGDGTVMPPHLSLKNGSGHFILWI